MKGKTILILFGGVFLALVLAAMPLVGGCAKPAPTPEEPIVMRCATEFSPAELLPTILKELETTVPQETGGRVKFELYAGASLYTQPDAIVAMQAGDLEMAIGGGALAAFSPEWSVMTTFPLVFDDLAHYERFLKSAEYKRFSDRMEAMGIKQLTPAYQMGNTVFLNSVRPIETSDDLKGLKLCGPPSPLKTEVMSALDIDFVLVAVPELLTALETGVVDGTEGNMYIMAVMDLPRLTPYCYYTPGLYIQYPMGLVVSTKWWDTLPSDLQEVLTRVFNNAVEEYKVKTTAVEQDFFELYDSDPRTVVTYMSEEDKAKIRELVRPIKERLMEDPNIADIFEGADATR